MKLETIKITKMGIYAAAIVALVILALQGCNLEKAIVVDAPQKVLEATGNTEVTLYNAEQVWNDWSHYVESNSQIYLAGVEDAEKRYETIHSLISLGVNLGGDAAETLPYGGLIFGALTGLIGLSLPQPRILSDKLKKKD